MDVPYLLMVIMSVVFFLNGAILLIVMVVMPFLMMIYVTIMGVVEGDLFLALLGPGFVLYILCAKYLFSGHWLRLFRRKNPE